MKTLKKRYYLIAATACLAAAIAMAGFALAGPFYQSEETQYVCISDQDGIDDVCRKLAPIASDHSLFGLRLLARHTGYDKHIRSGRYAVRPGESTVTVFRRLKNGRQEPLRLTIPESRTTDRLAGHLGTRLMVDSTVMAILLRDSAFCAQQGYDTATIVCLFVPDTYEVYWNMTPETLMARMRREHDRFWNDERRRKADTIGMTPDEVCTLASIVDEETANNAEKPMIAGMYLNRLRRGMPLQADPTVKFALKDFALRRIYREMLTTDSPYNTYIHAGLPPGPIKIASVKGIDAVLNRVDHDYLYMCAKEDFSGTHNFARTYQEHLKNAARYAKALNERGIK